jgi:hypothetical protein
MQTFNEAELAGQELLMLAIKTWVERIAPRKRLAWVKLDVNRWTEYRESDDWMRYPVERIRYRGMIRIWGQEVRFDCSIDAEYLAPFECQTFMNWSSDFVLKIGKIRDNLDYIAFRRDAVTDDWCVERMDSNRAKRVADILRLHSW